MNFSYSSVSIQPNIDTSSFKHLIEIIAHIIHISGKEESYFLNSKNIQMINMMLDDFQGKYLPGGRTVLFTIKFKMDNVIFPLILKAYHKLSPLQILNHIVSVETFENTFKEGIIIQDMSYIVFPSKNILVSVLNDLGCVFLIQEFSEGQIPNSSIPLSSICKIIGSNGFVIDFFAKNWRLIWKEEKRVKLSYIDTLLSNKMFSKKRHSYLRNQLKI